MRVIPRHDIDQEVAARRARDFGDVVEDSLDGLERYPHELITLAGASLQRMQALCGLDPTMGAESTREAVVTAMQAHSAAFAVIAGQPGGTAECVIARSAYPLPIQGSNVLGLGPGHWLNALWLAMACMEQERSETLCAFPLERLRVSGATFDPYLFLWMEALQSYWRGGEDCFDKLAEAVERCDPDAPDVRNPERALHIDFPEMRLLGALIEQKPGEFNESLAYALEEHRHFWTLDEERAATSGGYVALGPTALAVLAQAKGFPIEVESDYLPKHLIQADWHGAFPT